MTIHLSEELQNRNEALFTKLVPFIGPAATVEGEMLRAVNRIVYRYYNDGDKFCEGYGCETIGPAHAYLVSKSPLMNTFQPIFNRMEYVGDEQYERGLIELTETIVGHIELRKNLTDNDTDMLDSKSRYEDDEDEYAN